MEAFIYRGSYEDDAIIHDAHQIALLECMAEHGLVYDLIPYSPSNPPQLYGLTSLEDARISGYRQVREDDLTTIEQEAAGGSMDPSYYYALYGENPSTIIIDVAGRVVGEYDPNSCLAVASERISPGWERMLIIEPQIEEWVHISSDMAMQSEIVADAWLRWSDCMGSRDFNFANPVASYLSVWIGQSPLPLEIDTAVADVECKEREAVLADWSMEIARAQEELISLNPEVWEEWTALRAGWIAQVEITER